MLSGGYKQAERQAEAADDFALSKRLSDSTHVVNDYEKLMKEVLLEECIPSFYELTLFPTDHARGYLPDFVTALVIDGKPVVFELHSSVDVGYLDKLDRFRKIYNFYFVLISSKPIYGRGLGNVDSSIDEFWFLPNGIDNQRDYAERKATLKSMLRNFEHKKSPTVLDYHGISAMLKERVEYIETVKKAFRGEE